jgi:hypothetical protein
MSGRTSAKPNQGAQKKEKKQTTVVPFDAVPLQSGNDVIHRKAPCACGGGCPACKAKSSDVKISEPSDPAEIEADHIAEKVMRMPAAQPPQGNGLKTAGPQNHTHDKSINRKCSACDEEDKATIQRKPIPSSVGTPSQTPDHVSSAISSGGHKLDNQSRDFFEPRLGYDLSAVRVHTDSTAGESARAIDAKAYTIGNNIVFGEGEYQPESQSGKYLLAHELAHVTQSANGSAQINRNTIYRTPTPDGPRELQGIPKEGISLKSTPENKKDNNLPAAVVENGEKIVVKNGNVTKIPSVKNGKWAWIEVPGRTSPQKDYKVMHGFIETQYLSEAPKTADKGSAPQQASGKKNNTDLSGLSDVQLESEVNSMRDYLKEHSDADMAKKLEAYEAEASQRNDEERKLAELSDMQLESEVNSMRTYLKEHSDAKMAKKLATYEAEASRRVDKERKDAEAKKAREAAVPEEDIGDLESALRTLKNGRYVSPLDQGASGGTAEGPADRANNALSGVDEKFLVPATDEMATNPVLRLEGSIKALEARIAKQKQSVANWSTEAKLKKALEFGIDQCGDQLKERLKELLSPESLAIIAAFAVAYIISQTTPIGWVADILVAGMLAATILMVGKEAIDIVKLLIDFVEKAESAKSESDLKEAGKSFAIAVTKAGVDIIVAILLHKAGKAANLKPPGPRSPGLIEVLKTTGEKVTTTLTEPAASSGWQVAGDGVSAWDPADFNMSMMDAPPEGTGGPKSSSGSGKGSGTPKAGADRAAGVDPAKPTKGRPLSAGGGLPKKPIADVIKGKNPLADPPAVDEPGKSKSADKPTGDKPADKPSADKPADKPADKSADKPTDDSAAKDKASSKGASAEVDPQQGVKDAIERLNKKIDAAKAEMAEKAKEISKVGQEEWQLRDKLKKMSSNDPARPQLLEEWQAKQKRLAELEARQEHRKGLNDQDLETRTRLKNALDAKTYSRPGFTEAERAKIWDQAVKDGGGKVKSPSGTEIKPGDPWEVGHKPMYEFWKHVRSAAERGISREQFLRECKDLSKYRPETKADNSSHAFEDKTDAYLGE